MSAPPLIFGSAYERQANSTVRNVQNGLVPVYNVYFGATTQPVNSFGPQQPVDRNDVDQSLGHQVGLPITRGPISAGPIQPTRIQAVAVPSGHAMQPLRPGNMYVNTTVNTPLRRTRPTTQPTTQPAKVENSIVIPPAK